MSHIHLPDGQLPNLWWILGYVICFGIMAVLLQKMKGEEVRRKIPFVGVVAALMLITMSVPLGILPVHLSLAVLCGILAGPGLGFIAVFVVNVILAFMGHGGITVVGINTLIIGSEVIIGSLIFNFLVRRIKKVPSAVSATVLALLVSTAMMVGVLSATVGIAEALPHGDDHHHDHDHEEGFEWSGVFDLEEGSYTLEFSESEEDSMLIVFTEHMHEEDHDHDHDDEHDANEYLEILHQLEDTITYVINGGSIALLTPSGYNLELVSEGSIFTLIVQESGEYMIHTGHLPEENNMILIRDGNVVMPEEVIFHLEEHGHLHELVENVKYLLFTGWSAVGVILLAGILVECVITALMIGFFTKVRPDLVQATNVAKN